MSATIFRNLPSIDQFLRRENLQSLISESGRDAVRDRLREVLDEFRQDIASANGHAASFDDAAKLAEEIERRLHNRFYRRQQSRTQRVINATGVVIHTNLGRAPLAAAALQFPLHHPCVASVIPGSRSIPELQRTLELYRAPIPVALWDELKDRLQTLESMLPGLSDTKPMPTLGVGTTPV